MSRGKLLVWMVLGAALFGCSGGGGGGGGGAPEPPPSSKVYSSPDGMASVSVPSGTVTTPPEAVITITPALNPLGPLALAVNSLDWVNGTAYEFGPEGTSFSRAVTIKIVFDPSTLPPGVLPSNLRLGKVVNNTWEVVPGSNVNTASHFVSGNTISFSVYGVVEVPEPSTTTTTTAASTTTTSTTTAPTTTTTTTIPAPDTIKEADAEWNAWSWVNILTFFNYYYPPPYTDIQHLFGFFDWVYDPDLNLSIVALNAGDIVTDCELSGTLTQSGMVNEANPLEFIYEERFDNCQYSDPGGSGHTIIKNGVVRGQNLLASPDPVSSFYVLNYTFSQTGLDPAQPYTEEEKDGGGTVVFSWTANVTMTGTYRAKDTNAPYPGIGEIRFDLTLDGYEELDGASFVYTNLNDLGYYKWGDRFDPEPEELDVTLNGGFLFDSAGQTEDMTFTGFHYNDNFYYVRLPAPGKYFWSYAMDGVFDYTGPAGCPDVNGTFSFDTTASGSPITWDTSIPSVPGIPSEPVSGKEVIREIQGGTPLRDVALQVNGLNSVQASSVDEDWVKNFTSWWDIYTVCP